MVVSWADGNFTRKPKRPFAISWPRLFCKLYKKNLLKRSAFAFWSNYSFLSIKSSTAKGFTFAVESTDCIIFYVDLGLSFLVSKTVAKCCFFTNAIDLVN